MTHELERLYGNETWFSEIAAYVDERYSVIEERLVQTFRYVQLHPDNGDTFSYEFISILRDCGSVFTSALDKAIRETQHQTKGELNIGHFRDFLNSAIPTISQRPILVLPLSPRVLLPYSAFAKSKSKPRWWDSYNNVKHSEVDNYKDGNLRNVMNAIGALAILCEEMGIFLELSIFTSIGIKYPLDMILFPDSQEDV